mgnify:CR=1 FL=1
MGQCIYLPKELMTNEYNGYSAETKLLFGMILSNSVTASAVMNVADLINQLGKAEINALQGELKKATKRSVCIMFDFFYGSDSRTVSVL